MGVRGSVTLVKRVPNDNVNAAAVENLDYRQIKPQDIYLPDGDNGSLAPFELSSSQRLLREVIQSFTDSSSDASYPLIAAGMQTELDSTVSRGLNWPIAE